MNRSFGFLDLETTGLDFVKDEISLVGIADASGIKALSCPTGGKKELVFDVLVTYNGVGFDLPFLKEKGWSVKFNQHVDLMVVMMEVVGKRCKKDMLCRDLGIYVPSDPCGSGWNVARLGKKIVGGTATDSERFMVAAHNVNDLVATQELFALALKEGWVNLDEPVVRGGGNE